jgi:hypothetical protein
MAATKKKAHCPLISPRPYFAIVSMNRKEQAEGRTRENLGKAQRRIRKD